MSKQRPKRTRKDSNHPEIRDSLRDDGFTVVDVADLPGRQRHNPLDLFVMRPTDEPAVIIACSAEGVKRYFAEHPEQSWVQVEVKPGPGARLTDDEAAYLEALGVPEWFWL